MATPFGELLGRSTAEMNAEIDDYVALGVDWVRLDIHWSLVQPRANGSFEWSQVDKVFNALDAKGIKVTAVLNNTPNWVGDNLSSRADQEAFGRFAGAAAQRYDHIVDHWEVLNEQNKSGITPQNYTRVLQQAHDAIKAVNGDDAVITGGTAAVPSTGNGMWGAVDYLKQMYDAGAKDYFDAVGYHPYSFPLMPSSDKSYNGWQMMEDGIRKTMVDNGDSHKQVWMTEFGAKQAGNGLTVSQGDAARMLRDAVDIAEDLPWAGPIMWFSYQDSSFEPGFGLLDGNGNRREAYWAFKELGTQDGGSGPVSSPPRGETEQPPVYAAPPPQQPAPDSGSGSDNGRTIEGGRGNDVLHGTSGDDILIGRGGQDRFTGGSGRDTFVFNETGSYDRITDWEKGDRIDLRGLDADSGRWGHQGFDFVGSNWLRDAGDLGVYTSRAHNKTYIQANTDNDREFEVNIVLDGIHQLSASDFLI
ncbi:glycosyl hydrolase [Paracoccus sp. MC1862]|uniref:glycosyl hydrolase n=1 Tax=Paracoccus sp. MC1862 TaxID=2760307 RepID=UPI00190BE414|nr:glycosyl hydrolase [Paracoccus sp. MC1862]QQO46757.1 cellulase family glycosylhydrolase [Paracoccus sp. MC1862]